jgi:hypothetical protein
LKSYSLGLHIINPLAGNLSLHVEIWTMGKIIVSANCQTAALTSALRALLPNFDVIPFPMHINLSEDRRNQLKLELSDAEFLLAVNHESEIFNLQSDKSITVIPVPHLHFDAFHPDICYAVNSETNQYTNFHYNSRIAVWSYNQNVSIEQASTLFNQDSYHALGYLARWYQSENFLLESFASCGFSKSEFLSFFQSIKRGGVFMFSINHPMAFVSVELARLIVKKHFPDTLYHDRELIVEDPLTESIWPLYSEIGEELGLEGNYIWRIRNQEIAGLIDYLNFTFTSYQEQMIKPGQLVMNNTKDPEFHNLMTKLVKKS